MEYYYTGNNNKYKITIILYLYNKLGFDLSHKIYNYIYKYNLKFNHYNLYYYNLIYKLIFPINKKLHDTTIFRDPYYKNELFNSEMQFNKVNNIINAKRNCLRIITIINEPYFICKTDKNLKNKCYNLSKYLYDDGDYDSRHNKYFNDMNVLLNIKRNKLNIFDKIKIIKKIEKINLKIINNSNRIWWGNEYDSDLYYNLYLYLYNNYIAFLYNQDVYEPGYIIDKNNIVYGH